MQKVILLAAMLLFSFCIVHAQKLDAIGKEKALSMNGSASLSQQFYGANGIESRRSPYTYFANAALNLSIYGWSIPLSFSFSNQNTSFQQPFNQYSINPSYKFITAHVGYTSTSYSPYTLNGHIFLGASVALVPEGPWSCSVMHGRLLRATAYDTSRRNTTPAFQRMGTGFKAGYKTSKSAIDIIVFHSGDDLKSIEAPPDSLNLFAEENLVTSLIFNTTIIKNLSLQSEIAASALTRDVSDSAMQHKHFLAKPAFLFTSRSSTSFYEAFKTSLSYQFATYTIGLGYERIDPGYKTHGAYFFNNDMENITLSMNSALLKGKMQITSSVGTQRDNLDGEKLSGFRRMVGAFALNYAPSPSMTFSAAYSSFQSFTNIRSQFVDINQLSPYDNLDTLNFTQLSQNANLSFLYSFGKDKNNKQSLNSNFMYQTAAEERGGVRHQTPANFYNANVAYSINYVPFNMLLSISLNASVNRSQEFHSATMGPVVSLSRTFLDKKVRLMLSTAYNTTSNAGDSVGSNSSIMNVRTNGTFTFKKKHNLNLSATLVERKTGSTTGQNNFAELTLSLGYSFAFNLQ